MDTANGAAHQGRKNSGCMCDSSGGEGFIGLPFSISTRENFLFTDTLDTIIKIIPLPIIFRINRRWFCIFACGSQLKLKGWVVPKMKIQPHHCN